VRGGTGDKKRKAAATMQIDPHAPGDSYEGAGADRQLVVQVCVCVLELDAACGAGVLPDALTRRL